MTAKKRARNKKKKARPAAAAAAEPRTMPNARPQPNQKDGSLPNAINEDVDLCMHGLLQSSNEGLKETIRICDDVVSEDFMVVNKMFGGSTPQPVLDGRESISTILDEKLNTIFSSMEINDTGNDVKGAGADADDAGILFTIFA